MPPPTLTIELSRAKAIVLFDWLAALEQKHPSICDDAEQRVLWNIEGQLESKLVEVVAPGYLELVATAKKEILGE